MLLLVPAYPGASVEACLLTHPAATPSDFYPKWLVLRVFRPWRGGPFRSVSGWQLEMVSPLERPRRPSPVYAAAFVFFHGACQSPGEQLVGEMESGVARAEDLMLVIRGDHDRRQELPSPGRPHKLVYDFILPFTDHCALTCKYKARFLPPALEFTVLSFPRALRA